MHSRSWNLGRFWECTGFDSFQLEIRYSTGNPTYKILSLVVTRALAVKLNSIWQNKERFRRRQTVHLLDANFAGNQLFWGSNLWHKYPCFPNYQPDLVSKTLFSSHDVDLRVEYFLLSLKAYVYINTQW